MSGRKQSNRDASMPQNSVRLNITVKEIYDVLCPRCKKKVRRLIKEKITDQMVENVIGKQ